MRIVVDNKNPYIVTAFEQLGEVLSLKTTEVTREAVKDADVLIVRSETKVDRNLLDGTRVKFVGTATIGIDHIDHDYLRAHGIQLASAPGSNANSVAEYIIASLLVLSQRGGFSLEGKTFGIVGVGNVGSNVRQKAEALGLRVLLNDPPLARATGRAEFLALDELMCADFITIHVPLSKTSPDKTYHLFDNHRIGKMKSGSVLLNTSRGAVVETSALKEALKSGHLNSAVLDVWEGEPSIDVGLLDLVTIGTPHISGYSFDGKLNAVQMMFDEVAQWSFSPVKWNAREHAPAERTHFAITNTSMNREEALLSAVRQNYDVELDDQHLRRIHRLSEPERQQYFRQLRATYRVRREFSNTTVAVPFSEKNLLAALQAIGFVVETVK